MKFRYYITDTFDGVIKGTDDSEVATSYAASSDFFVIDTVTGKCLQEDGEAVDIEGASDEL